MNGQLQAVQERLTQLDPNNRDHLAEFQGLKAREAELIKQAEVEQAIEQKVETADVPFSVLGTSLEGLPAPVIKLIEKVVKADRKRIYNEHAVELQQIEDERDAYKAGAELKISNQDKALEVLRLDYETCARELQEQTVESVRLLAERDDYKTKLANAAMQLGESDAEINRLKSEIDDYQKAKVHGERQAQNIIDIDSESDDEIQAAADEVKKLYTSIEDWGSVQKVYKPDGSFDLVKRSELEQWKPLNPPLVDPVLPFQSQTDPTQSISDPVPAAEEVTPVGEQFQEGAGLGMAFRPSVPGEAEAVSVEDHEALKRRVERLEKQVLGEVAA